MCKLSTYKSGYLRAYNINSSLITGRAHTETGKKAAKIKTRIPLRPEGFLTGPGGLPLPLPLFALVQGMLAKVKSHSFQNLLPVGSQTLSLWLDCFGVIRTHTLERKAQLLYGFPSTIVYTQLTEERAWRPHGCWDILHVLDLASYTRWDPVKFGWNTELRFIYLSLK